MKEVRPNSILRYLLIVNSLVIIGITTVYASKSLASLTVYWNSDSGSHGWIGLPFQLTVCFLQYMACFRQNARAALSIAVFFIAAFLFCIFGFLASVVDNCCAPSLHAKEILLNIFCLAAYFGFCGYLNASWSKYLWDRLKSNDSDRQGRKSWRFQFTLQDMLVLTLITALIFGLRGRFAGVERTEFELHISREETPFDLPQGSSDICYATGIHGSLVYEFSTDKAGFREWARKKLDHQADLLLPIDADKPISIPRYPSFPPYEKIFYPGSSSTSWGGYDSNWGPKSIEVGQGIAAEYSSSSAIVKYVYDSVAGRAYCAYVVNEVNKDVQ